MLLEYLIEQNNIDIERTDVRFISDLILGLTPSESNEKSNEYIFGFIQRHFRVDVRHSCK
jgi:hypothetical protein